MLVLLIEAAVLMALLKVVNDEDSGLLGAMGLALGGAIGTSIAIGGCWSVMGLIGIPIGGAIAVGLLGVAISALYGIEIMRSFMIAGIFVVIDIAISVGWAMMTDSGETAMMLG